MEFLLSKNMNDALQKYQLKSPVISNQTGVICEENNALIGCLYYTDNHFHPYSIYLHFKFFIKNPEVDILNRMFSILKSEIPNSNYILNLEDNYNSIKKFIHNNGFKEIRKTYEPDVHIDNLLRHYHYIDSYPKSKHPPFVITNELVHKVQDIYRKIHVANPLGGVSLPEWKKIITNGLDLENSIVIYNENKEITAYLFIFHGSESTKEIGWVYYKNEDAKRQLLNQFKTSLSHLQKVGIKTICLEVDNTDKYAYELFFPFLIHGEPSSITYIKYK